jgi:hypothetical protein
LHRGDAGASAVLLMHPLNEIPEHLPVVGLYLCCLSSFFRDATTSAARGQRAEFSHLFRSHRPSPLAATGYGSQRKRASDTRGEGAQFLPIPRCIALDVLEEEMVKANIGVKEL